MRNSVWFLAALLVSVSAVAETAIKTFEVKYPYYNKNTTCTQSVIDALPLTLVFDEFTDGHILLVSSAPADETSLGKPVKFTKEGVKGCISYMSLGSTILTIKGEKSDDKQLLQQLWLQKKERKNSLLLSGFYLSADKSAGKECLVANDPKAFEHAPKESAWSQAPV